MTVDDFTFAETIRELFDYNHETGIFLRRKSTGSAKAGSVVGTMTTKGYLTVVIGNKNYFLHRLAWLYVRGSWPKHVIDHINGNKADNRIKNLRDVPQWINAMNRRSTFQKGYVGRFRDEWRAQVQRNGVRFSKTFPTEPECRQWISSIID